MEQPLLQAFALLLPRLPRISAAASKLLQRYEPCRRHASAISSLRIAKCVREIAAGNSRSWRDEAERQGLEFARREVPPECAVLAVAHFAESCLRYMTDGDTRSIRWRSAIIRWASLYQYSLLQGAAGHISGERKVMEDRAALAERRSQDLVVELGEAYEKERRRLAQDLHDEIGHDLIVLKLYTQVIALDLEKGEVRQLRAKLKESVSLIDHALKGVRHLVFDLGPAVWNEQGFLPAVRLYSRQFAARTGLKVRFTSSRLKSPMPSRYETALYKVLQGALANVAAHAAAHQVNITIENRQDTVVMIVEDDGRGFNVGRKLKTLPHSYGLRAMRDRIELLGGSIDFKSQPARRRSLQAGTRIEIQLPVHEVNTT